jgi:hypothetical protein
MTFWLPRILAWLELTKYDIIDLRIVIIIITCCAVQYSILRGRLVGTDHGHIGQNYIGMPVVQPVAKIFLISSVVEYG